MIRLGLLSATFAASTQADDDSSQGVGDFDHALGIQAAVEDGAAHDGLCDARLRQPRPEAGNGHRLRPVVHHVRVFARMHHEQPFQFQIVQRPLRLH